MNFVYGGIAIVASFFIANYFNKPSEPKWRIFVKAFLAEACFITVLGFIFLSLNLGFFADNAEPKEHMLRIVGFAVFLGVLVGIKAQNRIDEPIAEPHDRDAPD